MSKSPATADRSTPAAPVCVHHFIINSPNGPTCEGICRKCKARRTWSSSGEADNLWPGAMQAKRLRGATVSRQAQQFRDGQQ